MEKKGTIDMFFGNMSVDPYYQSLWEDEEFKAIIQRQEKKFAEIRAEVDRLEEEGLL